MVSDRKYVLMVGWARYSSLIDELSKEMDRIEHARGTIFGIAVDKDYNALLWQRLNFRIKRAKYAVGMFGLVSMSRFAGTELVRTSESDIKKMNSESFSEYRKKAREAKKLLEAHNLSPCSKCLGAGYFMYGGDETYPCENCQKQGIVFLEENAA